MQLEKCIEGLQEAPGFSSFPLRDKNPLGGTEKVRLIRAPNQPMRVVHARFIKQLRKLRVGLPFATGARPGDSIRRNVLRHSRSRFFYLVDLASAYRNLNGERLTKILCELSGALSGRESEVHDFLRKFCLAPEGGLIVGAPASPDLFNLYAGILIDRPMAKLCLKHRLTYTRYLDDLTFSAKRRIGWRKRQAVREIISQAGFGISHRKALVADLKKGPIKVNGIRLELGGRIMLPRDYLRKIRGLIHLAMTGRGDEMVYYRICGMMGVFWSSTSGVPLNAIEHDLVRRFREYQEFVHS
ncbi:MAG: hypothetical protein HY451_00685 [Parcubacteria group bacterium]|nr:hypothetical protein [Parcubacteria group bacterium]